MENLNLAAGSEKAPDESFYLNPEFQEETQKEGRFEVLLAEAASMEEYRKEQLQSELKRRKKIVEEEKERKILESEIKILEGDMKKNAREIEEKKKSLNTLKEKKDNIEEDGCYGIDIEGVDIDRLGDLELTLFGRLMEFEMEKALEAGDDKKKLKKRCLEFEKTLEPYREYLRKQSEEGKNIDNEENFIGWLLNRAINSYANYHKKKSS